MNKEKCRLAINLNCRIRKTFVPFTCANAFMSKPTRPSQVLLSRVG